MQKGTPDGHRDRLVPVANRRVPRASRNALTSDGASRVGGSVCPPGQAGWHSGAVLDEVVGSPNTLGHSPKARLVVTMTEVRS
jgi:hypothetical protein